MRGASGMTEIPQGNSPDIDLFLWSKVRQGDKEAFELLFNKYHACLCIFSKRYTGDLTMAREVIQNLFITLWENRSDLDIKSSLKLYLFQSTKYNSIRYLLKIRKQHARVEEYPASEEEVFVDQVEYAELQGRILDTIDTLPDQCRKVFTMSRFEQLKYADIAKKLEISVKTVESHITKALRVLEHNLSHY